ncbi:MAG: response regulator [Chloroflexi bacterium]|nr:response regulator [Chloroflexota bacterium]
MNARTVTQGLLATLASVTEQAPSVDTPANRLRQAGRALGQELERRWRADEQSGVLLDQTGLVSLVDQIVQHLTPSAHLKAAHDRLTVTLPAEQPVTGSPGADVRLLAAILGSVAARHVGRAVTRLTLGLVDTETTWMLTIRLAPTNGLQVGEEEYRQPLGAAPSVVTAAPSAPVADTAAEPCHDVRLRVVGEMAVSVAHGLNNLLAAVAGQSAHLLHEPGPAPAERLRLIHQAALDGAELTRRLLQFSRGGASLPSGDLEPVDLNGVIRDAVELTRPRWHDQPAQRNTPIQLQIELGATPVVVGVASELREALVNLIVNAVDAMPHGGILTLQSASVDGQARITCQDTGRGIPSDVQARIFQPFFSTKGARGTGMGLAIVYGIAARHGGEVAVESEPGHGATFTLTLPAAEPDAFLGLPMVDEGRQPPATRSAADRCPGASANRPEDTEHQPASSTAPPHQRAPDTPAIQPASARGFRGDAGEAPPLSILVVDDDSAFRAIFTRRLGVDRHAVVAVGDAATALQRLDEAAWDLICIDKRLPERPGHALARTIRQRCPDSYIVLVSGYATGPNDPDLMTPDVDAVLPKPSRDVELLDVLRQVRARRRRPRTGQVPTTAEPPAE